MNLRNVTDHIGIITACACIVHCIALPFLLLFSFLPAFEQFHAYTLALTVVVTGHALWHGYREHCRHIVVFFGGLGVVCLLGGMIAHEFAHGVEVVAHGEHLHTHAVHNELVEYLEIGVTVVGSLLIVAAHVMNLKFKRKCCH